MQGLRPKAQVVLA